mmetsp:Transcript_8350/g.6231  ORF Transcript_8350/g.6231 Transcript_8350/m.6231 type:complete len:237 (+) Transcript_8350:244-954(+)
MVLGSESESELSLPINNWSLSSSSEEWDLASSREEEEWYLSSAMVTFFFFFSWEPSPSFISFFFLRYQERTYLGRLRSVLERSWMSQGLSFPNCPTNCPVDNRCKFMLWSLEQLMMNLSAANASTVWMPLITRACAFTNHSSFNEVTNAPFLNLNPFRLHNFMFPDVSPATNHSLSIVVATALTESCASNCASATHGIPFNSLKSQNLNLLSALTLNNNFFRFNTIMQSTDLESLM